MLQFHKHTHEEALLQTLRTDPSAAGRILNAADGDTIRCVISFEYTVPAKLAKAVLADAATTPTARSS